MVAEVAEEGSPEEVVVKLAGVVEEGSMVVVVVMIMICLNIRVDKGSDCKILQSNPFKQTILQGSP